MSLSKIGLEGKSSSAVILSGVMTGACIGVAGGLIKAFNEQMINNFAIGFFKTMKCILGEAAKGAIAGWVITGCITASIVCLISSLPVIGSGEVRFR